MNIDRVFTGPRVTLEEVLENRSARAERQQAMLASGCASLVSASMNIPGDIKQFPLAHEAFCEGLAALRGIFAGHILREETISLPTGDEALLALDLTGDQVKRQTVSLEEAHPLGRLFDLDVLDGSGTALSRSKFSLPPRRCLLCGENAKICGRSRAHTGTELRSKIVSILDDYFRERAASHCISCALRAMLREVSATPKPGLVDRANSGSHDDMDLTTFLDSAAALAPWFGRMFLIGWDHEDASAEDLFPLLQSAGRQAERAMLAATGGVNTHKGLIYSLGLLCGALGAGHVCTASQRDIDRALTLSAAMGRYALLTCTPPAGEGEETFGQQCRRLYGIAGIRGEAANGFPSVTIIGLPTLKRCLNEGYSLNDASAVALLALIAAVEDTNMIRRGGLDAARRARREAQALLPTLTQENCKEHLARLDRQYIAARLSPGGCADLLALSLFLLFWEQAEDVLLPSAAVLDQRCPLSCSASCGRDL